MTDPATGADFETLSEQVEDGTAAVETVPSSATAINDVTKSNDEDRSKSGNEGAGETTEGTSDEEEEEDDDEAEEGDEDEDDDDDDEDDDEPRLKYARLTQNLGSVYRNADATSSFLVAGDKMV